MKSGIVTKYYFAGSTHIALRKYVIPQNMTVEYFLSDHLGSTSLTVDSAGNKISELRYKPWGETRYTWTDPFLDTTPAYAMTRYQYTGQFSYAAEFGLYFYNARWYDSQLGRFAQADTIIPGAGSSQAWDRYAYANNNPLRYSDPNGHWPWDKIKETISTAISIAAATVSYIKDNPITISKNLSVNIPVVTPLELGGASKVLTYSIDLKASIRTIGRTAGEDLLGPAFLVAGGLLTVAPNQIENIFQGASWNDYVGDALVDTGGFIASEIVGDMLAVGFIETGPGAIVANFVGDIGMGSIWEKQMDEWGSRQDFIDWLGQVPGNVASAMPRYNYYDPVPESPDPQNQIILPNATPKPPQ